MNTTANTYYGRKKSVPKKIYDLLFWTQSIIAIQIQILKCMERFIFFILIRSKFHPKWKLNQWKIVEGRKRNRKKKMIFKQVAIKHNWHHISISKWGRMCLLFVLISNAIALKWNNGNIHRCAEGQMSCWRPISYTGRMLKLIYWI